jgi:4-amino-4-deoxy-L-arabinose transferase-like glycosyltransferase
MEPFWFFVPILLAGIGPWLLPFLRSLKPRDDATLFLVAWSAIVLVFFSASSSKLPPYVLPIVPAAALLVGRAFALEWPRRLFLAQTVLLLVGSAAVALVLPSVAKGYAEYARWLMLAFAVMALAAALGGFLAWRGARGGAVVSLAAGGLVATQIGLAGHLVISERFSVEATVARLAEQPPRETPVFAVAAYDHTIPWALKRTVTMVVHRDELDKEIAWEPAQFVPDLGAFASAWNAAPQAWAFVRVSEVEKLSRELHVPFHVMARGPVYAIVRKP